MNCTAFKNIFDKSPFITTVDNALARIQSGKSKQAIDDIRGQLNKERADKLKQNLPCILFSGEFTSRDDKALVKHSGLIVLDFDDVDDLREKQTEIISNDFVYACWVSPRGNGLKALVRIADGTKHREHFAALQEAFPGVDKSGVNEARVCYESYDPEIYINKSAKPFTKIKTVEKIKATERTDDGVFQKLVTWLVNKGDAFVTGERNSFVFKLASACCRFGLHQDDAESQILANYETGNTFTQTEVKRAVNSAYKANRGIAGSASFEKDVLIDSVTRSEVKLDAWVDDGGKVKDVIYGEAVKDKALSIYRNGYEKVNGVGVEELDRHFKLKKGESTLFSGIGNYGKSSFLKWFLVMRAILFGEKFGIFPPEDNPAEEFFHDLTEILLGADCTPKNQYRPKEDEYSAAYDWIGKHFFDVYPKTYAPTPEYLKEKFLELMITENISGCIIDPFNQMVNDYSKTGGRSDKYLETFLSDWGKFIRDNDQYGIIIAHPKLLTKQTDGNYPCPDVFDIADGAMWNNKMDNILIYHRPLAQTDPKSAMCEFHSKKVRRQKIVGLKGSFDFILNMPTRRFLFSDGDPMEKALRAKGIEFRMKQAEMFSEWRPVEGAAEF